jgi:soluble lytic murein transglycosylase-like protein
MSKSFKLLILTVILSSLIFAFPLTTGMSLADVSQADDSVVVQAGLIPITGAPLEPAAVTAISSKLARYGVADAEIRDRAARAIVSTSAKYDVAPELVASIMIVESRANPFAVSERDSVGIMQIHLPTWGTIAEEQGINLFKVEDNVELGVRILKGYVNRHGLWEGVARYKGFTDAPGSRESADDYVRKVQRIYGIEIEGAPVVSE